MNISFLTYVMVTAFTPGPSNLISLANGGRYGFRRSLKFIAGVFTGAYILMNLSMIFCRTLSEIIPQIIIPMTIVGALYLLYLAYKILNIKGDVSGKESRATFKEGIALQFLNPKMVIHSIVSMETFVIPITGGKLWEMAALALFLALASTIANTCWNCFGSILKELFTKYKKITSSIMALALVYCAIKLIWSVAQTYMG